MVHLPRRYLQNGAAVEATRPEIDSWLSRCPGDLSMKGPRPWATGRNWVGCADAVVRSLRSVTSQDDLASLMLAMIRELGFRYYALIHHDDLRTAGPDRVDIKHYPNAVTERLFGERRYRRDPVIRGCIFADSAFLWSDLHRMIQLNKQDRLSFEFGAREGLNEGITVPYMIFGECPGSCTFAGMRDPEKAEQVIGLAQMIGVFAFQTARRLTGSVSLIDGRPRLYPRIRDCIVLAGRGYSNKEIARALGITPRTVDGYMTEAYQLFEVHGRTELVVSAVLAGDVGLHELKSRQSG